MGLGPSWQVRAARVHPSNQVWQRQRWQTRPLWKGGSAAEEGVARWVPPLEKCLQAWLVGAPEEAGSAGVEEAGRLVGVGAAPGQGVSASSPSHRHRACNLQPLESPQRPSAARR